MDAGGFENFVAVIIPISRRLTSQSVRGPAHVGGNNLELIHLCRQMGRPWSDDHIEKQAGPSFDALILRPANLLSIGLDGT
jgi:hypothetical protein